VLLYGPAPADAAGGSISGVVVDGLEKPDGGSELLVGTEGDRGTPVDEIRLELPRKAASDAEITLMPEGWSVARDGRDLVATGPVHESPIYLRVDLGDARIPDKIGVEVLEGGRLLFERPKLEVRPRTATPPATSLDDALVPPAGVSPGERILLRVLDPRMASPDGEWVVGDSVGELLGNPDRIVVHLPEDLDPGDPIGFSYRDPWGILLLDLPDAPRMTILPASPVEPAPAITGCAPRVFTGSPFCVCGSFPDEASQMGLTLDGEPLGMPLAATGSVLMFEMPESASPGEHWIAGSKASGFREEDSASTRALVVSGSIDQEKLFRGESTPMRLVVDGTESPLAIRLRNVTPAIIKLEGGVEQVAPTSGGSENSLERQVRALQVGNFNIHWELDEGACPCLESPPGTELVSPPILIVDWIRALADDGTVGEGGAVAPGGRIRARMDVVNQVEGAELFADGLLPGAQLWSSGPDGPVPVETLDVVDCEGIVGETPSDIWLVDMEVPAEVPPGDYNLSFELDELVETVEIEIATRQDLTTREQALDLAEEALGERLEGGLDLLGGSRPLPGGSELCNGLTGELFSVVGGDESWLFFAFDPESGFAQPDATWLVVQAGAGEVQVIDDQGGWPEVRIKDVDPTLLTEGEGATCQGSRWGPAFGSPKLRDGGFFGGGGVFYNELPAANPPRRRPAVPVNPVHEGRTLLGTPEGPCPDGIKKIALLIQLDDNNQKRNEKGKEIPDFDDVMDRERRLMRELGFNEVHEIKPDDLNAYDSKGKPKLRVPSSMENPYDSKPILDKVRAIVGGIDDCCTEVLIIVNAHQTRNGYLRFSNRGVPYRGKPNKTKDVKKGINAGLLARHIAATVKEAAKDECPPKVELIFHSCFSGRFAHDQMLKAANLGIGITASSSEDQTTRGSRKGGAATTDEYFFLEALKKCVDENPGKPLSEIWDCIVEETRKRSAKAEEKKKGKFRKKPQRPKRLPPKTK
jgi:hypothetical protein